MVARRAHNPKVVGSNPAPATRFQKALQTAGLFLWRLKCRLVGIKFDLSQISFIFLQSFSYGGNCRVKCLHIQQAVLCLTS